MNIMKFMKRLQVQILNVNARIPSNQFKFYSSFDVIEFLERWKRRKKKKYFTLNY